MADYYEQISDPMDLTRIQQKVRLDEYEDVEQMAADFELLINNAKTYYPKESQEYQDASELWDFFNDIKSELLMTQETGGFAEASSFGAGGSGNVLDSDVVSNTGSDSATDDGGDNPLEELFSAVMNATDDDGRPYCTVFQLLPSKIDYPDYYQVITEPIDLKIIGTKIKNGCYQSLNELERDLLLMCRNAKHYNEPGSQIYKDANTLRKIIAAKKLDLDQRKFQPHKISERIRAKRNLPAGQKWSAIAANLKHEPNTSDLSADQASSSSLTSFANIGDESMHANDETNDSEPEDAESNPQWQLYEYVRGFRIGAGAALSDPFMRLPSRRFYPDYYTEIKNPISLAKIRAKIKVSFP